MCGFETFIYFDDRTKGIDKKGYTSTQRKGESHALITHYLERRRLSRNKRRLCSQGVIPCGQSLTLCTKVMMQACGFSSYYSEAMIIHIFMHIICTHTEVQDSGTKEIDQRLLCLRGSCKRLIIDQLRLLCLKEDYKRSKLTRECSCA